MKESLKVGDKVLVQRPDESFYGVVTQVGTTWVKVQGLLFDEWFPVDGPLVKTMKRE